MVNNYLVFRWPKPLVIFGFWGLMAKTSLENQWSEDEITLLVMVPFSVDMFLFGVCDKNY